MKLAKKIIFFSLMLVLAASQSGCIQKALFPEAHFTVVSVTPDKLRATVTETTAAEGSEETTGTETKVTLPSTVISLNSDSQIPADLVSFSIHYTTRLGEAIPAVAVPETPYSLKITPGEAVEVPMSPYTTRLYTLLELTRADISPVNARMTFLLKDGNGNKVHVEASCLIYATWDEIEGDGA
ncbi:MAG: hypothetical protein GQF41_2122 [Candidatus Rifleibacterium amylolyticum]|nr:MAG: hypothetical protein GQF41_2122 [Candidatus Rifleibacterium amylolyticum]